MGRAKQQDEVKMKIGIMGLGSIGQRHGKLLLEKNIEVYALRTNKGAKKTSSEFDKIKNIYEEEEFDKIDFNGYLICNPTGLHAKTIKKLLIKNKPLFVEKPISTNLEEIKNLETNNTPIMVGYNLRYHPIIEKVKEYIKKIGPIYKANIYCGQYLPSWHPYTDYSKEYFSKKSLGGGAIRTMSHDIDLARFFFGDVKKIKSIVQKISDLNIDVDDYSHLIMEMESGEIVSVEDNYLDPRGERSGEIFGKEGMIKYSFAENKVEFINNKNEVMKLKLETKDSYEKQMNAFLKIINKEEIKYCNFEDGVKIMKIIDIAEKNNNWSEIK